MTAPPPSASRRMSPSGAREANASLDAGDDVAGLAPDADARAARKAYHRVARKCHPDKVPHDAPDRALEAFVFSALTDALAETG